MMATSAGPRFAVNEETHIPTVVESVVGIRRVGLGAPGRWLIAGWRDLRRAGRASLFYGICFAAGGWLIQIVFAHAYPLLAGLIMGFLLLAPLLAMGLYDLSRRIAAGEVPRLAATLGAWRPNLANVGVLAAVLAVAFLLWARASMVIFALFFDTGALPGFADVVRAILAFEQPQFALVYLLVGSFFALFVFAISVVAVPLMLDRGTDAVSAAIASLGVCARNPAPMLLWAGYIVVLVAVGLATQFVGLIVVMPVLGHASWHAYHELVPGADLREAGQHS
jgi:uncharacterized membrane protein